MEKTKNEILKESAKNNMVNITKTSLNGIENYNTILDENGEEYSEYKQWLRIIQEYALIMKKESRESSRDRQDIKLMVEGLILNGVLVLNDDYSIKTLKFKTIKEDE